MAHEDAQTRLLLIRLEAAQIAPEGDLPPTSTTIVIDRSGSMEGGKLRVAREATARLIRSLRATDEVAVVAYDDHVMHLGGPCPPSESLAACVEHLHTGGCTNLYGGWLTGAKLLRPGGRVLLLSDGLANAGRYTQARDLEAHASLSYHRFGIVTSTIGIGHDYDEALMAGMARGGGGSHYFSHTPESIMDAFSRESFVMKQAAVHRVAVAVDGQTIHVGTLVSGERRAVVVPIGAKPKSVRVTYEPASGGSVETIDVAMPKEFVNSPEATAEHLSAQAATLEQNAVRVRSRHEAEAMLEENRQLQLAILAHPLADEPLLRTVRERLQMSQQRLAQLAVDYDEEAASYHRKRSMQSAYNMTHKGRGFSSFAEERRLVVRESSVGDYGAGEELQVERMAFRLRPPEFWLARLAVPVAASGGVIIVALADPSDGFAVADLSVELGVEVRPDPRPWPPEAIGKAIDRAARRERRARTKPSRGW